MFLSQLPVGASGGERIVDGVESNGIDRIDEFNTGVVLVAMAFEGVLLALSFGVHVEVLDSDAAFDRAHHEALSVGKAADSARLELERRFARFRHSHVRQRPDADLSVGCTNH